MQIIFVKQDTHKELFDMFQRVLKLEKEINDQNGDNGDTIALLFDGQVIIEPTDIKAIFEQFGVLIKYVQEREYIHTLYVFEANFDFNLYLLFGENEDIDIKEHYIYNKLLDIMSKAILGLQK